MSTIIFDVPQRMGLFVPLLTCALLYVFSIKRRLDKYSYKKVVFDRMLGQVITKQPHA